jgi:hypothetical protein
MSAVEKTGVRRIKMGSRVFSPRLGTLQSITRALKKTPDCPSFSDLPGKYSLFSKKVEFGFFNGYNEILIFIVLKKN